VPYSTISPQESYILPSDIYKKNIETAKLFEDFEVLQVKVPVTFFSARADGRQSVFHEGTVMYTDKGHVEISDPH
jgi:hypothetical protein